MKYSKMILSALMLTVSLFTTSCGGSQARASAANVSQNEKDIPSSLNGLTFNGSVRDDVTGNWRYAMISTSAPITDYALDYYNTYFESDKEIHFVINASLNTTNRITQLMSNILDVTVLEHKEWRGTLC